MIRLIFAKSFFLFRKKCRSFDGSGIFEIAFWAVFDSANQFVRKQNLSFTNSTKGNQRERR
jgi:hypothetical protein